MKATHRQDSAIAFYVLTTWLCENGFKEQREKGDRSFSYKFYPADQEIQGIQNTALWNKGIKKYLSFETRDHAIAQSLDSHVIRQLYIFASFD